MTVFFSGSEQLTIDRAQLTLKANHLIVIPPNTEHSYKFLQNSTVLDIKFTADPSFCEMIDPILNKKEYYLNTPSLLMLMQQLHTGATTSLQKKLETCSLTLDTLLKLFLLEFYQEKIQYESLAFVDASLIQIDDHPKIQPMIDYLNNHYSETIDLKTLSEKFHYSESYITRIFRDAINLTPNQVLQKIRLEKGIQLLDSSTYSIEFISNSIGLSLNYFSKFFKEQKGVTPTAYRKSRRKKIESLTLSEDFDLSMEP
nr:MULTISPECIES: AraC family transcriptional regulator [unclassified Enterococcus]